MNDYPIVTQSYKALELQHRCLNEELQFHEPGSTQYEQVLIQLTYVKEQLLQTTTFE